MVPRETAAFASGLSAAGAELPAIIASLKEFGLGDWAPEVMQSAINDWCAQLLFGDDEEEAKPS
jgi:hypothetical protein